MFIDRFKSENGKIEYTAISSGGVKVIPEKFAHMSKTYNIYFLANVRNDLVYGHYNRAKDIDIAEKSYLAIDIDLRKQYIDKYKEKITDEEIIEQGELMAEYFENEHEYLGDYDFIVFSGNGLHIYYLGKPRHISPDNYAYAMDRIMREWDKYWGDEIMNSDKACKNIARILRLPGSINQKTGKTSFVIRERQGSGKLFNSIELLAEAEKEEVLSKREEETRLKIEEYSRQEKMNKLIKGDKYEKDKDKLQRIFKKIDSIPINLVAEKINPMFPLSKNGKNFDNEKGGYCGYYVVKELNSICNGGSRYFLFNGDVNSCWSPSVLIKHQYDLTWGQTIQYFKDNFGIKT